MTAKQLECYENFMLLRAYLIENKKRIESKLDMGVFRSKESDASIGCGTVGCILGHSLDIPEFKKYILKPVETLKTNDFSNYSYEVFGIYRELSPQWDLLFGTNNTNSIDDFIVRLDTHLNKYYTGEKEQPNEKT